MENLIWIAPVLAIIALIFAAIKTATVSKAGAGTERMQEIAASINEGARAFLFAEYKILVIFVAILFILIGIFISWLTAVCFIVGALFSVAAGYVGMNVATKAMSDAGGAADDQKSIQTQAPSDIKKANEHEKSMHNYNK